MGGAGVVFESSQSFGASSLIPTDDNEGSVIEMVCDSRIKRMKSLLE